MTTLEVLKHARETLSDRANWTRNTMARDTDGHPCRYQYGVSFCSLGALWRHASSIRVSYEIIRAAERLLCKAIGGSLETVEGSIAHFNDSPDTTHEMVLNAYDRAIELAEGGDQ
jgi:hypothetical protein